MAALLPSLARFARRALSPELWQRSALIRLAWVCLVIGSLSYGGNFLSQHSGGIATIWLSNGVFFGLVVTQRRRRWPVYFIAALFADLSADLLYGEPVISSIGASLANSLEVLAPCVLLRYWFNEALNLSDRKMLLGFLLAAVLGGTALSGLLGTSFLLMVSPGGRWATMFGEWYLGDMLGMAVLAPLVITLQRPDFGSIFRGQRLPGTLLTLCIPAATIGIVFARTDEPLLLFVFPALLIVVFSRGTPGTAIAVVEFAVVAITLTLKGHGPVMLIGGDHALQHRVIALQLSLAVATLTMLPVAALLEERETLKSSLQASEARYRRLAHLDELTGLPNRRAFNAELDASWEEAATQGRSIALVMLDADYFKQYNDVHGHFRGDECLQAIARVLMESVRREPFIAARIGGEEFAVILPGYTAESARAFAETVRTSVLGAEMTHPKSPFGVQTVSLGIAALVPQTGLFVKHLLTGADAALYQAKSEGKNRVAVSVDPVEWTPEMERSGIRTRR